jgi:hypothetical protein
LSETFPIVRKIERGITNVHSSARKVPVILVKILMKLEFHSQIFEKYSDAQFYENPSSGRRVVLWRRTD